mmetsp:Transcript_29922/g.100831  ORF Transcript_29922/g.100831 Transcript_29922/m.100831 type:complete len:221 (-) Transcript_29922:146-808(-)
MLRLALRCGQRAAPAWRAPQRQVRNVTASAMTARLVGEAGYEGGLDAILARLDKDGNGTVDGPELAAGLRAAGLEISDGALKKLMATYATGAGQTLDAKDLHKLIDAVKEHRFHSYAEEAVLAVVSAAKPSRGKAVPQRHYVFDKDMHFEGAIDGMFASLDVNGDGMLQPAEIKAALAKRGVDVSGTKFDDLFTLYDANGDGVLQLGEFAKMVDMLERED